MRSKRQQPMNSSLQNGDFYLGLLRERAPDNVFSKRKTEVRPMIHQKRQGQFIVKLISARRILCKARITQPGFSVCTSGLVVRLAQHMFVASEAPPRQVWDGIPVVGHTPMVKFQPIIVVCKFVISNSGLPHCVN